MTSQPPPNAPGAETVERAVVPTVPPPNAPLIITTELPAETIVIPDGTTDHIAESASDDAEIVDPHNHEA